MSRSPTLKKVTKDGVVSYRNILYAEVGDYMCLVIKNSSSRSEIQIRTGNRDNAFEYIPVKRGDLIFKQEGQSICKGSPITDRIESQNLETLKHILNRLHPAEKDVKKEVLELIHIAETEKLKSGPHLEI
jgi:hypothetical protein